MKRQCKRKILWIDEWRIEDIEAWFSNMAAKGWELCDLNRYFATFKQTTPQVITYRCDVINQNDPGDQARFIYLSHSNWKYIAKRKNIHVFKMEETDQVFDDNADFTSRLAVMQALKQDMKKRILLTVIVLVILIGLHVLMLQLDGIRVYLNDTFISTSYVVILLVVNLLHLFFGVRYISNYINEPKVETLIRQSPDYNLIFTFKKFVTFCAISLFLLIGIVSFLNIFKWEQHASSEGLADHNQSVIRLSDVMDSSEYGELLSINKEEDSGYYFNIEASILVPKQIELIEFSDHGGDISLISTNYETRYNWLAKRLANDLKQDIRFDYDDYQLIKRSGFDEVWVRSDHTSLSLIVRLHNKVYGTTYSGKVVTEDILNVILNRMSEF